MKEISSKTIKKYAKLAIDEQLEIEMYGLVTRAIKEAMPDLIKEASNSMALRKAMLKALRDFIDNGNMGDMFVDNLTDKEFTSVTKLCMKPILQPEAYKILYPKG
jgi:hypothetical protein